MEREFIKLLKPQNIFKEKQRFGPYDDGGYVVPKFVLGDCTALYTYGIGRDTRFEEDFGRKYNKPAYLFDHTIRTVEDWRIEEQKEEWRQMEERLKGVNCHFSPTGLGHGANCHDFIDDYQSNGTEGYVILKIDIEGGEYEYFKKTDVPQMESTVISLVIEVHGLGNKGQRSELISMLRVLDPYFVLNHIHANNWGMAYRVNGEDIPESLELTFVNKKFVEKYEPDNQDYPIKDLDLPNNPGRDEIILTFINAKPKEVTKMNISIGDVIDRYSICKLKSERLEIDNGSEIRALKKAMSSYEGLNSYVDQLYKINGQCWDMEADIRKGNEKILGLEEVGRRALKLRDLNNIRVGIKNEVNSKHKEGFIDIKMEHGSEEISSLVISLTTVPERLSNPHESGIKKGIKSLCEQTDTDYEIHFNIPKTYHVTNEEYIIPDWLDEYKLQYPHLRVFRTEDFGPPTKVVPTLKRLKDPETILLVVDDDLVYHKDMVSEHRKYQDQIKDSCICYEGRETSEPPGYGGLRDAWILCVDKIVEVYMFQHYKSASYKKKLFTQDFFDYYLGKTFSDDVLLSRFFNNKGVKIFVVPYEPENPKYATLELWTKNHGVETFPVLSHTHNTGPTGCNHPGLLSLPTGGRFYEPNNLGNK